MKKKILVFIVMTLTLSTLLYICASAAKVGVAIGINDYSVTSASVSGNQAKFYGYNYDASISYHKLEFIASYTTGGGWKNNVRYIANQGTDVPPTMTTNLNQAALWRLTLDPVGPFKNCIGRGFIESV